MLTNMLRNRTAATHAWQWRCWLQAVTLPYTAAPLLAWGGYTDNIVNDGWSYLAVYSNESQPAGDRNPP